MNIQFWTPWRTRKPDLIPIFPHTKQVFAEFLALIDEYQPELSTEARQMDKVSMAQFAGWLTQHFPQVQWGNRQPLQLADDLRAALK